MQYNQLKNPTGNLQADVQYLYDFLTTLIFDANNSVDGEQLTRLKRLEQEVLKLKLEIDLLKGGG